MSDDEAPPPPSSGGRDRGEPSGSLEVSKWELAQGTGLQGLDSVMDGSEDAEAEFLQRAQGDAKSQNWEEVVGAQDAARLEEEAALRRRLQAAEREKERLGREIREAVETRHRVQAELEARGNRIQEELNGVAAALRAAEDDVASRKKELEEHQRQTEASLAEAVKERARIVEDLTVERTAALRAKDLQIENLRKAANDEQERLTAANNEAEERVRNLASSKDRTEAELKQASEELARVKFAPGRVCIVDHNGERLCNVSACTVM